MNCLSLGIGCNRYRYRTVLGSEKIYFFEYFFANCLVGTRNSTVTVLYCTVLYCTVLYCTACNGIRISCQQFVVQCVPLRGCEVMRTLDGVMAG